MKTKQDYSKRIDEINVEIRKLQEEGVKIIGKMELLSEQEKEKKEEEVPKA